MPLRICGLYGNTWQLRLLRFPYIKQIANNVQASLREVRYRSTKILQTRHLQLNVRIYGFMLDA